MVILGVSLASARKPTNVFSQGTRNLIKSLKAAGAHRLVVQSSFGVADSRRDARLPERFFYDLLLRGAYADMVLQEEAVRASGIDYTIVRPTRLTMAAGAGRFTARVGPGRVPPSIARADVARFILDALGTREYVGKTVSLGGRTRDTNALTNILAAMPERDATKGTAISSEHWTPPARSKLAPRTFARRRASRVSGAIRVGAPKPMTSWRPSTAGSPRVSTRSI